MFSAYLVDDEPLILSALRESIPWFEHNFQLVGAATDPGEALREIASLRPDVVFTDIKMPMMTGFDLIKRLREQGAECEFVIVSAYEKFEYARQVIQLEGFDYLIKPVEPIQFADLMERLHRRLEKKFPSRDFPSTSSAELNRIILHLNRNPEEKYSLAGLAKQFNISPNYICSLFSKHMDTTFSAYLLKIRMEYAARLLKGTAKPVKEVAVECGYEDYFYFCRVFRDYFSRTPTQYRSGA